MPLQLISRGHDSGVCCGRAARPGAPPLRAALRRGHHPPCPPRTSSCSAEKAAQTALLARQNAPERAVPLLDAPHGLARRHSAHIQQAGDAAARRSELGRRARRCAQLGALRAHRRASSAPQRRHHRSCGRRRRAETRHKRAKRRNEGHPPGAGSHADVRRRRQGAQARRPARPVAPGGALRLASARRKC